MKLLLDTHIILWSVAEPERLALKVAEELESDANELWFSPISVWETLLLAEKGRISGGADNERAVRGIFSRVPLKEAPLNQEVAIQSRLVELPHQDPADRFIAATAVVFGLTLVTADTRIINSAAIPIMPAI